MAEHDLRDVGGTPGGLGHFLIGFAMACIGGYLLAVLGNRKNCDPWG